MKPFCKENMLRLFRRKRLIVRVSSCVFFTLRKNTRFLLKILLYSQLLQVATIDAASITTDHNSFIFDHTSTKKLEQTLHHQIASTKQMTTVLINTDGEPKLPSINRAVKERVSISQRRTKVKSIDSSPKKPPAQESGAMWVDLFFPSTNLISRVLKSQATYVGVRHAQRVQVTAIGKSKFSHYSARKELQAFQEKLKANSSKESLPNSHSTSNPLLRQQGNEKPPVTLSDLPYIGPVAAPLTQWAQSGSLSNISLTSQQLGLNAPLSGGVTYSNVTGVFLNAQYIQPLADQIALGVLGEYGSGQYRLNGTVAYGFTSLSQIKVTGEYLVQRLPFQFDSGSVMQRLHQSAYGVRFQQLFEQPYWQNINLGGYYASAANKDLPPVIFIANGFRYLNERRIAGASSLGIDVGTEVLLSPKTLLGGNVYFDRVSYGTQLTGDTNQNRQGLGGGVKIKQLFGGNFKLWGEVSVRKIYDSYEGGISWLPLPKLLGLEVSLLGQHVVFHNSLSNNSNVSLQVKWLPDSNPHYDERFTWKNKQLTTVSQWVKTPAVYMPQVLAIAEQITSRLLSIIGINPNSGPAAGGNTVTITGSRFVDGLLVFFGGQLANAITILSPTTLTVEVPGIIGSTAPQPVDVVIKAPDGQQVTLTNGYTYNSLPSITSIAPPLGPVVGGTLVTILGASFEGATRVTFGGVPGTNVAVSGGGTQLTVITPAGAAGAVDVVITAPNGKVTAANGYTYIALPTVAGINPPSGPAGGGVPVTITGTGFVSGQSTVTFGGNAGVVTSVSSDGTQLTVTTPAGTAGPVDVVVTTPGGSVTKTGGYTYVNQPS
ncbi:MAG: hypothetical protein RLY40_247, partial [Pseudomonadota bacterium]